MPDRLQEVFEFVKNNYFPGWDEKGKWKVEDCSEELNPIDVAGLCDKKTRTIKINTSRLSEDEDELYVLLTHEICHCHNVGHGENWKNLMFKTADRVWRLGHLVLSSLICTDVSYTVTSESMAAFRLETKMYGWIAECIDEYPNIPFDELMSSLIEKYG